MNALQIKLHENAFCQECRARICKRLRRPGRSRFLGSLNDYKVGLREEGNQDEDKPVHFLESETRGIKTYTATVYSMDEGTFIRPWCTVLFGTDPDRNGAHEETPRS
jgi:hypothetical protein